ncbi:hypothetical protein BGY98DRAFT_1000251 [Russula aff. rugulosa BPL654]|nr:hypothetical protein BGY98DRAFT_1000251 [Russula aff. rugulosa BPL654]
MQTTLLLIINSTLTTALTLTSPSLSLMEAPPPFRPKGPGSSPVAFVTSQKVLPSSYSITGTFMGRLRDNFPSGTKYGLHSTDQIGFVRLYVGM